MPALARELKEDQKRRTSSVVDTPWGVREIAALARRMLDRDSGEDTNRLHVLALARTTRIRFFRLREIGRSG